jgi:hypothetical protein
LKKNQNTQCVNKKNAVEERCDCRSFCDEVKNRLNIHERIRARLDELASLLETQSHLHSPALVTEKLDSVAKFWSALSEEEREYCSAIRIAVSKGLRWKEQGK